MDPRELQAPLEQRYRAEPSASLITLTARGGEVDASVGFSAIRVRFETLRNPPAVVSV